MSAATDASSVASTEGETPIKAGVIDVHAHWLPRELYDLPPGSALPPMNDRNGELYLGDLPLSIAADAMSDVDAILADNERAGIAVRVLSAPPFAFPVGGSGQADGYIRAYNSELARVAQDSAGRLLGLGLVRLDDIEAARSEMRELSRLAGIRGIALPSLVPGQLYDEGVLCDILRSAVEFDLAVLVHPMQLPRAEWPRYYLANLLGNPVETATAVASVVLGGVIDELPDLRICFVHGGGCASSLLGRWNHGWQNRRDASAGTTKPPAEGFRKLYFDTLTHDPAALTLLASHASPDHLVCGSDYPFDMAEVNPVDFAVSNGVDAGALERNARAFIGLRP
ncbi:MAG: 2-hydroxy-3-carboxy-6-oxo-7-methylocta-2,4-dienoate decarboxylase, partial [Homoserinimonas sp.]|nr:2-hydroxy-3-carboxy-6-oxo-7-methylocta-2,4-dienoate decarboxylase [Homoserinimonas sp.]